MYVSDVCATNWPDKGGNVLISVPVQDSEVFGKPHVQLIAVAAVSSAHVADITDTVPSASRSLPHSA